MNSLDKYNQELKEGDIVFDITDIQECVSVNRRCLWLYKLSFPKETARLYRWYVTPYMRLGGNNEPRQGPQRSENLVKIPPNLLNDPKAILLHLCVLGIISQEDIERY